ncbi:MAG: hypothetical protein U0R26_11040 [Solirubrobacterales bacterium]
MGEIVAAIAMSHAPPLTADYDAPPADMLARIHGSLNEMREILDRANPDVIVAVVDDHFENFFGDFMPTVAISVADTNFGPPDHYLEWLKIPQHEIPNNADLAREMLRDTRAAGFGPVQSGRVAMGHALMVPLHFLRPQIDIPVVPVLTNVFTPPLADADYMYRFGEALRDTIDRRSERAAVLATGALSHWPPFWSPDSPEDDEFLQRMRRFQTTGLAVLEEDPKLFVDMGIREKEMAESGAPLVNAEWDETMMKIFAEGDVEAIRGLEYDRVEQEGGNGGHEILNWVTMAGMLGGAPMRAHSYDDCPEWMCGMGFLSWSPATAEA